MKKLEQITYLDIYSINIAYNYDFQLSPLLLFILSKAVLF